MLNHPLAPCRFLVLLLAAQALTLSAHATELRYSFHVGDETKYRLESQSGLSLSLGGAFGGLLGGSAGASGAVSASASTQVDLIEKVTSVNSTDGSAEVTFSVKNLTYDLGDGKSVSPQGAIPDSANTATAHIDATGKIHFYKMVSIVIRQNVPYLIVTESTDTFDASTPVGNLSVSATYAISSVGYQTVTEAFTVQQDDNVIDTVPKQIASLLELPTGDIENQTFVAIAAPGMGMSVLPKLLSFQDGTAKLQYTLAVAGDTNQMTGQGDDPDAASTDMSMSETGTIEYDFDVTHGQLISIQTDNLNLTANIMGAQISQAAKIKFTRQ